MLMSDGIDGIPVSVDLIDCRKVTFPVRPTWDRNIDDALFHRDSCHLNSNIVWCMIQFWSFSLLQNSVFHYCLISFTFTFTKMDLDWYTIFLLQATLSFSRLLWAKDKMLETKCWRYPDDGTFRLTDHEIYDFLFFPNPLGVNMYIKYMM